MIRKQSPTIQPVSEADNILFDFQHLQPCSYTAAERDGAFFISFLDHLRKFGQLRWSTLYTTQRHGFGTETMEVSSLCAYAQERVPADIKKLLVLRATGNNHVFLGYRMGNVFHILFLEYRFGDIYSHG